MYYKDDFTPRALDDLKEKVRQFENLWATHENKALMQIPDRLGAPWPFKEIHVYCFEGPEYRAVPCISDPVSINMGGENLPLLFLFFIHELVHLIMQFDERFSGLSLDEQEAVAYFTGNKVLEDTLGKDSQPIIEDFTIPWPYDFPRIVREYQGKIDLSQGTIIDLIEKKVLGRSR